MLKPSEERRVSVATRQASDTSSDDLCNTLLGSSARESVDNGNGTLASRVSNVIASIASEWPHIALTLTIVTLVAGIGLGVPQVEVVLGYKGALGGSLIVFVFPALMHFALSEQRRGGGSSQANVRTLDVSSTSSSASATGRNAGIDAVAGEAADAEDGEITPLKGEVAKSTARSWMTPLFTTPHGALLCIFGALGGAIMVLGTLTTAGVISG